MFMSNNRDNKYDFEMVTSILDSVANKQYLYKNQHLENLQKADWIMKYQVNTQYKIEYFDTVYCPKCGEPLKIDLTDGPIEPGKKRRKSRYVPILKCTNCRYTNYFNKKGIVIDEKLDSHYMLSKKIMNAEICIKTIEERLG